MFRFLIIASVIGFSSYSLAAQEPQSDPKKAAQKTKPTKQGTENNPIFVKVIPSDKSDPKPAEKQTTEKHSPQEERIADATVALAWITGVLAFFTALLWFANLSLVKDSKKSAQSARDSADATRESVDAALNTSMPILFPKVINMAGLHPLIPIITPYTHESNIFIKFENFGGTPATIREVRAKLYLTLKDIPPAPDPSDWAIFSYSVMIPGNSRADDQHFGALDMKQTIVYGQSEIAELHREADPDGTFRRFVLMGQVTYDDLFGWRHVRTYCVKMRAWVIQEDGPDKPPKLNQFQVGMGGSAYNKWTKEKIPNPDPLA